MGRPKGSKNKSRKDSNISRGRRIIENNIPAPEIGKPIEEGRNIQPSEIKTTHNTCLTCGHHDESHYGSVLKHCNMNGCLCRELKINK